MQNINMSHVPGPAHSNNANPSRGVRGYHVTYCRWGSGTPGPGGNTDHGVPEKYQ